MRLRLLGLIYSLLCGVLAAACLWFAFDEWLRWRDIALSAIVFLGVVAALFGLTSVSVVKGWRAGAWLAGGSGALLVLYGLSVVFMGWEDVGGARGAIPLALGTGVVGGLGLITGIGQGLERGEAA